jgi:hypothetical protein
MIDGKEVGKQIRRAQTGKKMSDATNRARNLLSTLDREDSVSFYAVRGVLKECIAEIETQCTEGAKKDAVLLDIASQSKSDELGDDREGADFEGAYDIMIQLARSVSGRQK